WSTSSSSKKLEPWYLPRMSTPRMPPRPVSRWLLAAALDVVLDELLGVLLEDLVDLVDQGVHLLLQLLALLGELLGALARALAALVAAVAAAALLLLLGLGRRHEAQVLLLAVSRSGEDLHGALHL